MQISTFIPNKFKKKYSTEQGYKYLGEDYWDWWVSIHASETDLDKIDQVTYNLHYTFPEPVRIIDTRENDFKLESSGWGVFTIYISILFKDETVLKLEHELELEYPDGTKNNE